MADARSIDPRRALTTFAPPARAAACRRKLLRVLIYAIMAYSGYIPV
jgi:hypothetical protein